MTAQPIETIEPVAEALPRREIRVGQFTLDPDTGTLLKGKTAIHLRPKEAALLALLMGKPGKVLSRQRIMKEVWETDYHEDTRTLSVHMRWLRIKIEKDPSSPRCLRTVRGVGYCFDPPDHSPPESEEEESDA